MNEPIGIMSSGVNLGDFDDLLKEHQILSDTLASEASTVRIKHLEADITRVKREAEEALANFEKSKSSNT